MSKYATINPATGERVAEFPTLSDSDVEHVLTRSFARYTEWRDRPLSERAAVLHQVAKLHRERADELAALLTLEIGKPTAEAKGEVALVASIYDYYADNAERFLREEPLEIKGPGTAVVRTEAIGPLIGIMPWNFPYYQVARFAGPNIVLGNTIILKHSSNCPQSALAIEAIFRDAGLPADVYINAFATSGQISAMIADPRVQGVSLTGSEKAGSAVAEVAGRHLKKVVLELGGSDPFIVLPDADLDEAVAGAVSGRMYNGGQACTASKRFIIVGDIYDEFLRRYTEAMSRITPGDPLDPATSYGPLSSQAAADEIAEIVHDATSKGATAVTGGQGPEGPGAYYPATVLTGVTPQMRAYSEEIFGPAAVVYRVESIDAAVDLANDSPYGLSSSIFTTDIESAKLIAERLETGMVWVNSTSRSTADLPFGGVKRSGFGRELAHFGINEFANKKLIRIPAA
ncbi:succinate-semialdehyde dehydrogenase [Arthrobacter psychrolactophilus]|uniref:Succinate-semialdehyde dehydrogenase n=1 Tax=Arthrobacter psychrolactophilus TaxID=92442 RepID=A0A2V5IU00_9MICC|nr:NAD-dependent succinate-semialdehyde dehydrogenase [Arthrobacter psychrolactophilus]PYI39461.1 succinate-semialdehyde dehydrogenase [Arthrobacter psychrolactophilus]